MIIFGRVSILSISLLAFVVITIEMRKESRLRLVEQDKIGREEEIQIEEKKSRHSSAIVWVGLSCFRIKF